MNARQIAGLAGAAFVASVAAVVMTDDASAAVKTKTVTIDGANVKVKSVCFAREERVLVDGGIQQLVRADIKASALFSDGGLADEGSEVTPVAGAARTAAENLMDGAALSAWRKARGYED